MEAYPTELTSPPVPLVALCGKQEVVRVIADYLRTQHLPRVHTIGIEDAHSAAGTFGARKPMGSSPVPPHGILKAGWLRKHRTQRPGVAGVLVDRDAVVGDPSSWAWLVSQLDAVKAAAKSRGARMVVVVVVPPGCGEVAEDRMAMLCRQAGADRRCVITYCPAEGLPALQVVGRVLHEQAVAFYAADAQRRLAHHAHRNVPSADLNLRVAFKLGALAEFRADWGGALRMYAEAYGYVPQLLAAVGAQPQRFAEVRAVAEQVHVKVVSLLLLALKQLPEAMAQFEAHLRLFRRVPFQAPPGLLAGHHAWLCRQYMVVAELLLSCGADLALLKREQQPGQLYLSAAKAAIERRKVAAFISGMHGGRAPTPPGRVEPGLFVGQLLLLPPDPAAAALAATSAAVAAALAGVPVSAGAAAAGAARRLTDEQFELALEAEECAALHSKYTVDLLRTAQDVLTSSGRRANKTLQHVMLLLGDELLESGDVGGAERLLTEVAGFYRRERWEGPLATALLLLRECRQHSHDLPAHTELSLEVAALAGSSLDAEQRAAMATAAVSVLVPEPTLAEPGGAAAAGEAGEETANGSLATAAAQQAQQGMQYAVAAPNSGWLTVLPLCAGFFDPLRDGPGGVSADGAPSVHFGAALWNNAPIHLPLASAEVLLSDGLGSFSAALLPAGMLAGAATSGGPEAAVPAAPPADLSLPPGAWLRLTAAIPVRCSGELQATAVVLRFADGAGGGGSTVEFQLPALLPQARLPALPSSPSRRSSGAGPVPAGQVPAGSVGWLRGGWASGQTPFSVAAGFLPGQCRVEVPPQHAPPLLLLQAPEALLQGEQAAVSVTITAAGDALAGAVLRGRALHVESQQELGLLPVGGTVLQQQQQQQQQDSSEQGQGADGTSAAGGGTIELGDLAPGQRRQVVLLLDARYRGSVQIGVELQYTAGTRGGKQEAGHCTASLAVSVQLPWRLGVQLLGPPATHTLLAAPAGQLEEQRRRLQSLSVQDSPSTAALGAMGSELGPADGRDLSVLLLRGLPPRLVLPAGQRCTLLVQLQSLAACQVDVLGVELEAADGASAAPPVAAEATAAGGSGSLGELAGDAPDTLNKSDVFTAAFSIGSSGGDAAAGAELPSLGFLRLRWRRHQRRPPLLATASRGGSQLSAADAQAAVAGVAGPATPTAAAAAAAPACEALVPLPGVSFLQPLLTAGVRFPPTAAAGCPLPLELSLHNASATCQDVAVAVGDPHGFLLAGPKSTSVQLPPHSSGGVSWQAVPYHTGLLRLPEITASAAQQGQQVEVTRGCSVFVERPPELKQADGAAAAAVTDGPALNAVEQDQVPRTPIEVPSLI